MKTTTRYQPAPPNPNAPELQNFLIQTRINRQHIPTTIQIIHIDK